jgi:hypothetical protein
MLVLCQDRFHFCPSSADRKIPPPVSGVNCPPALLPQADRIRRLGCCLLNARPVGAFVPSGNEYFTQLSAHLPTCYNAPSPSLPILPSSLRCWTIRNKCTVIFPTHYLPGKMVPCLQFLYFFVSMYYRRHQILINPFTKCTSI